MADVSPAGSAAPAAAPAGVLLLGFGGPDSLDAVAPFLERLLGRTPPPGLVAAVTERYRLVGGRSPLPAIAAAQARALQARLNAAAPDEGPYRVYVGMRCWHPFIAEAAARMSADGVARAVAVSLSPHRSRTTTDAYARDLEAALAALAAARPPVPVPRVTFAPDWYLHPLYLDALAERLEAGLAAFPAEARGRVEVLFTAHSLPLEHVRGGDPYVEQLRATAGALAARAGLSRWRLAFQSRGAGGGAWLGPQVEEVLDEIAAAGGREVLVDPIGFVTDHMETLYDIDVLHRRHAAGLGLRFERCACPNDAPALIAALADIALSGLRTGGGVLK